MGLFYLTTINLITFVAFGFDKFLSKTKTKTRIPENVLHSLQLFGGSPASLFAMMIFRHKNRKTIFIMKSLAVCMLQIYYVYYIGYL
jgi:uncharacterized membrane protein YsdA (DUF1294 family)